MPRLVIKRASSKSEAPEDRNEGTKRYLDTDKRQGFTSKSKAAGGTIPGRGGRGGPPQRAGLDLGYGTFRYQQKETTPRQPDSGPPTITRDQSDSYKEALRQKYLKQTREELKKNLGKRFNGSAGPTVEPKVRSPYRSDRRLKS